VAKVRREARKTTLEPMEAMQCGQIKLKFLFCFWAFTLVHDPVLTVMEKDGANYVDTGWPWS
jgi:hypothetical protein